VDGIQRAYSAARWHCSGLFFTSPEDLLLTETPGVERRQWLEA
jgi:hypothetical protein